MSKFHINKYGAPAVCRAKKDCPLGGAEEHFVSKEDAQDYIDKINEEEFGIVSSLRSRHSSLLEIEEKMKMSLNVSHIEILDKIRESGFKSYVVGGSVRDSVVGIPSNDVDIATDATVDEINHVFKDYRKLDVGSEYGTVPIIINNETIEITTFRKDGEYSDGRRPDTVSFTRSLKEDVSRRDFTINSIAYNPEEGIIDTFDGLADIESKTIKTVGNPDDRFKEDPLRIVRGLRFASQLDFKIEDETEKAIINNQSLLKNVSAERIQKEFNKLIQGQSASKVLTKYPEVVSQFIPEMKPMINFDQKNPNHIYDVWEHSSVVTQNAEDNLVHKLAGVFHDIGKPSTFTYDDDKKVGHFYGHAEESVKIADRIMRNLKYTNKTRERVLNIIEDHDKSLSSKPYKVKKDIYEKGPERFFDMINFKKSDDSAKNPKKKLMYHDYDKIEKIANDYINDKPILSHKDIAIEPKDIIDLGYKGKDIGTALDKLCLATIGGIKNEKESQINFLKKNGI